MSFDPVKTRRMWRALHLRALTQTDLSNEPAWIAGWFSDLSSCSACNADAVNWVTTHPPDLRSPEAYFTWTIQFHNYVNEKLGVPVWSVAEARQRWQNEPLLEYVSMIPTTITVTPLTGPLQASVQFRGGLALITQANGKSSLVDNLMMDFGVVQANLDNTGAVVIKKPTPVAIKPLPVGKDGQSLLGNMSETQKLELTEAARLYDTLKAGLETFIKNTSR